MSAIFNKNTESNIVVNAESRSSASGGAYTIVHALPWLGWEIESQ